ncbi:hypothetical protein LguiA_013008 [Lonicera macranthoides]
MQITYRIWLATSALGLCAPALADTNVINHGISEEMMSEAISLNKEFFGMAAEEKAGFYCEDFYHNIRLYTSGYNYYAEDVHYWKDTLKLPCNPLETHSANSFAMPKTIRIVNVNSGVIGFGRDKN